MSNSDWWGDWRPNLPAHTGDLQPTDLIECTSIIGGQPVNTAITGQQIINAASGGGASWGGITGTLSAQTDLQSALNGKQATLVSGTSIKTINSQTLLGSGNINIDSSPYSLIGSQSGTAVVGTINNTISATQMIPANTLITGNVLQIRSTIFKDINTTSSSVRIYLNTSNTLTGATLIATAVAMTSLQVQQLWRDIPFISNTLYCYGPTISASSNITNGAYTLVTINPAINYYLLFAVQNGATADRVTFLRTNVMKYA